MKKIAQFAISIILLGLAAFPVKAAFSSVYVFGDALSATTGNSGEPKQYYGGRYCNGRVWVEVLAQRLGTTINYNGAYYDCASADLSNVVKNFSISPSDAANALFVVWGNNADLFDEAVDGNGSQSGWTTAINAGQANELYVITNLYNKGVRTLVMPSVVDISQVPNFSQGSSASFLQTLHNESIAYNIAFANTLNQARALCPYLTIYEPDFFGLLNTVLTNGAAFGLTNALYQGATIGAMQYFTSTFTNGPGTNFIYWDYLDPTAKLHEIMADETVPMIAPVHVGHLALLSPTSASICTNRLDLVNVPVGLNGFVDGTTNLEQKGWTWAVVTNITSTSTMQSIFVDSPALPPISLPEGSGPINPGNTGNASTPTNTPISYWQSYRLRFPMAWNWP